VWKRARELPPEGADSFSEVEVHGVGGAADLIVEITIHSLDAHEERAESDGFDCPLLRQLRLSFAPNNPARLPLPLGGVVDAP
jgi:hypothetical protein